MAALLIFVPMGGSYREVFEAAMVCLICPTATAAAVITGKLGGSASSLTTYTLLSNILAAVAVPLIFPLVEPHTDVTFFLPGHMKKQSETATTIRATETASTPANPLYKK